VIWSSLEKKRILNIEQGISNRRRVEGGKAVLLSFEILRFLVLRFDILFSF